MLADQREEAARVQERVQGHLNAMAMRLGELQAQMLRLDGLGERLAKSAGSKPQELPIDAVRDRAGTRWRRLSSMPSRNLSVREFADLVDKLTRQVDDRAATSSSVLEALLVHDSRQSQVHADALSDRRWLVFVELRLPHRPVHRASSRCTRASTFPRRPERRSSPRRAARSSTRNGTPHYGKMVEIDHGNGLVSRYAHASKLTVKEGDLVVRGQRIAAVGSTGRSTGPHLHFEVRLNGVPQNPARFLQSSANLSSS